MSDFLLRTTSLMENRHQLCALPPGKLLINCLNAYSYVVAKENIPFAEALNNGNVLLPDGMSIVWSCRLLKGKSRPQERITGWDLFAYEMNALNSKGGKCFFMGSDVQTLEKIKKRASQIYPNIIVGTYSPPFAMSFSDTESHKMIDAINSFGPDLLWIGLSAPKQEIWTYQHWDKFNVNCHVGTIGAVFSFFAEVEKRAPKTWQKLGLEWLYRLLQNPQRLWKRYVIGNIKFIWIIGKELFDSPVHRLHQ